MEPLFTVCCVSFQIFTDTFIYQYMYTVFLHKCDQIMHVILRLASVLNNILVCISFIHKIFTKGLGTRLTRRISALMNLVILAVVFPPTSTSSFSTAEWCYNLYSQPLALHTELVSICSSINNTAADTPCSSPWVTALGTGRENRLSNQSARKQERRTFHNPNSQPDTDAGRGYPVPEQTVPDGGGQCSMSSEPRNSNLHPSSVSY